MEVLYISKRYDLTGQTYGRLTVIRKVDRPPYAKDKNIYWLCQCSCGTTKVIIHPTTILLHGKTLSCGCYQKQMASKNNKTHGKTKTRLYSIWQAMKRRCYNPKDLRYNSYGMKGIQVCSEWLHDYMSFEKWALSHGYNDKLSIDRIDVLGDYEPNNCRWTTMKIQQNNRSNNRLITYNGVSHTLSEWADISSISLSLLHSRLNYSNWTIGKALTTPSRKKH